ncbi:MAG: DUF5688 family protein [Eubacteriales bacterium]|nr:DUF5688 family protein [Eubacteriales bacterium]
MNYNEFLNYIKDNILEVLKNQKDNEDSAEYEVSLHKISKNNGIVLDGLSIRKKGEYISPNIYLNSYYEGYQMGKPISVIMEEIVYRYEQIGEEATIKVEDLTDFNAIKDKIVLRLVNYEKNQEVLKHCPHRKYLDLAITFRYIASKGALGVASSLVSNTEFELWKVDLEELYHLALFNTMREFPWKMESLVKIVTDSIRNDKQDILSEELIQELEQMENGVSMYVLTNDHGINGATSMLYDHVIYNFAKVQDCNIYILPSSVHEVMLVPENADVEPEFLSNLVMEANQSTVGYIDLLSDHVYYYDKEREQVYIYGQN